MQPFEGIGVLDITHALAGMVHLLQTQRYPSGTSATDKDEVSVIRLRTRKTIISMSEFCFKEPTGLVGAMSAAR